MRYKVVAIRDRAIGTYSVPQFVASIGVAVRGFTDAVNNRSPENALANHPEDFDLFELSEFDDDTGRFHDLELPRQVAVGKDLVRT